MLCSKLKSWGFFCLFFNLVTGNVYSDYFYESAFYYTSQANFLSLMDFHVHYVVQVAWISISLLALCQGHDSLVPLVSHHSSFVSHKYSQALPFKCLLFRLYCILSFRSCCLIWLAAVNTAGFKLYNLTCCVGTDGNRDTFREERSKRQHGWQIRIYWKYKNSSLS